MRGVPPVPLIEPIFLIPPVVHVGLKELVGRKSGQKIAGQIIKVVVVRS